MQAEAIAKHARDSAKHGGGQPAGYWPEWRFANASSTDELPEYIPAHQAKALVAFLSEGRPHAGGKRAALTWHELRNRASVGLQLGAGLTPRACSRRSRRRSDKLRRALEGRAVEGRNTGRRRVAGPRDADCDLGEPPAPALAASASETGTAGPYLFPSTKSGKPWGKVSQYLAAKEVLAAAGFPEAPASGGSFRMRHTFALRQLWRGRSEEDVARWLGIADPAVMVGFFASDNISRKWLDDDEEPKAVVRLCRASVV